MTTYSQRAPFYNAISSAMAKQPPARRTSSQLPYLRVLELGFFEWDARSAVSLLESESSSDEHRYCGSPTLRTYKKAFELDPNDATAHQWYAYDISMIGGREQLALAEAKLAQRLDPLSPATGFQAFSLSSGKIPVIFHLAGTQNSMGMGQCRVQLQRLTGGGTRLGIIFAGSATISR